MESNYELCSVENWGPVHNHPIVIAVGTYEYIYKRYLLAIIEFINSTREKLITTEKKVGNYHRQTTLTAEDGSWNQVFVLRSSNIQLEGREY